MASAPSQTTDPALEQTVWDLEPLVEGEGPDGVEQRLGAALERAKVFAASYSGELGGLDVEGLRTAMGELAVIADLVGRAGTYAALMFSADTADPANGALLAVMDGRLVTEMRTAAVTAVSVDLLARKEAGRLAILGSGVQARSHLRAVALVRGLTSVRVWSRTAAHAERFVHDMAGTVACPLAVAATAREAMRGADLVVAVTSAREPVVDAAWLEPGMHLCAVGSSTADMREVSGAAVARCRVFVDSRASAAAEAGDQAQEEERGPTGLGLQMVKGHPNG